MLHYPSVTISPNVTIGKGVYILLGTSIMPHTVIKDYVMISMNVGLAHHNVLEAGVFLSSGGGFDASIHAHKGAYCGIASTIMTGLQPALINNESVKVQSIDSFHTFLNLRK